MLDGIAVLLGAPTGSGKTIVCELAMFRLFNENPGEKVRTRDSSAGVARYLPLRAHRRSCSTIRRFTVTGVL